MSHVTYVTWKSREQENRKFQPHCSSLQHTAAHCNTLQHKLNPFSHLNESCHTCNKKAETKECVNYTAAHRNTLQRTATHYNTLQHPDRHSYKKLSLKDPVLRPGLGQIAVQHKVNWYLVLQKIPVSSSIDTPTKYVVGRKESFKDYFSQQNKKNSYEHCDTHQNRSYRQINMSTTLQHTAAPCTTLQHTVTHCNTLQHTATHFIVCLRDKWKC